MTFASRFVRLYFDRAYNPVYDFVVSKLNHYHEMQRKCVERLELQSGSSVLCAGLGTGNEIGHILKSSPDARITGVDFSARALEKARRRATRLSKTIETHEMDVHDLRLPSDMFDGVMCLHVMDFVRDARTATRELLRVLRDNGRFVITYPSHAENLHLGGALFQDTVRSHLRNGRDHVSAVLDPLVRMAAGIVYVPLLFRPGRRTYRSEELRGLFNELGTGLFSIEFSIEEAPMFHDYIVFGQKRHLEA